MPEQNVIFLSNSKLEILILPNLWQPNLRVLSGPFLHPLLDPKNQMNKPVDLNHPSFLPADLYLVQEVALRLILTAADS